MNTNEFPEWVWRAAAERALARAVPAGDCLEWTGSKTRQGYGHVNIYDPERRRRLGRSYGCHQVYAHRAVWRIHNGPIPDGAVIDHLCENSSCIRFDHLRLATVRQNVLKGAGPTAFNAGKTHCIKGHKFTLANTRVYKNQRICRKCDMLNQRARRKRLRELMHA